MSLSLTRHRVWRNDQADPANDHEEAGGEVVRDDVGHHVAAEVLIFFKKNIEKYIVYKRSSTTAVSTHHLEPCQRVVP